MIRYLFITSVILLFSFDSPQFERRTIEIDGHELTVEIADTDIKRAYGLMHREQLNENEGMLFIFPSEDYATFWMKETMIPLSVGFFDENRRLFQIESMPVERGASYRLYRSKAPTKYALEVNKGWFKKNKVKINSRFTFTK